MHARTRFHSLLLLFTMLMVFIAIDAAAANGPAIGNESSCIGISGRVSDAVSGVGLSGMSISIRDMNMYSVGNALSGADGRYCAPLAAGSYYLWVENGQGYNGTWYHTDKCADLLTVGDSSPTAGINIALARSIIGSISGKATNATNGLPLAGINISVKDSKNLKSYPGGVSDASGNFLINGLTSGAYNLTFGVRDSAAETTASLVPTETYDPASPGQKDYYGTLNRIVVTAPVETSVAEVPLQKVPVISGTITDVKTRTPLNSASVKLLKNYGRGLLTAGYYNTDMAGNYNIIAPEEGSYMLSFSRYDYLEQWYDHKSSQNNAGSLPIDWDNPVTITANAALEPAADYDGGTATIQGQIALTSAESYVKIIAINVQTSRSYYIYVVPWHSSSVAYSINKLPAGDYKLVFNWVGNSVLWYGGSSYEQAAVIHVTDGSTTSTVDISMKTFSGAISGTVSDKTSGAPIAGIRAEICIRYFYYDDCSWQGISDQNGNYKITGLPPGTYDISFSPETTIYSSKSIKGITVADGAVIENLDVQLERGGKISGTVHVPTCPDGSFSPYWYLVALEQTDFFSFVSHAAATYADINGNYRFENVPPGTYIVNFNYPGFASQWYSNRTTRSPLTETVTVVQDSVITGIDATFSEEAGSSIEGYATDSVTGKGIFNLTMACQSVNDGVLSYYPCSGQTDSRGFFRVGGLPAGSYRIGFSGMGYLPGEYNATFGVASNITDAKLVLIKGGTIAGTVTDAANNAPLGNVRISFRRVGTTIPLPLTEVITDRSGNYRIKGLAAGDYYLKFDGSQAGYVPAWYGGVAQLADATVITVGQQTKVTGIDMTLQKGGSISGSVTDAQTGKTLSGIIVYAFGTAQQLQSTQTDASGSYTMKGVSDGSYKIKFYDANQSYAATWYYGKQTQDSADSVTITNHATIGGINGTLTVGGKISGKVYHALSGELHDSLTVTVYDAVSGEYIAGTYINTGAAANGYAIGGLASGTYKIQAYKDSKTFGWYSDKTAMAAADTITVSAPGTTSGIDIFIKEQDIQPPTITQFSIPVFTNRATIPVTLTATDNVAVTGYCINDSPYHERCNWKSTPQSSYLFENAVANANSIRWLYAFAKDAAGNISYYPPKQINLSVPGYNLSVDLSGSGAGAVHSIPAGLSCITDCSAEFPAGLPITLTATPDSDSIFFGWSQSGCAGIGNCTVSLNANSSIRATFSNSPAVRIYDTAITPFAHIADAYKATVTGKKNIIQVRQIELTESVNLNRPVQIILQGGFNSEFSVNEGFTTLKGIVTISAGSLTMENLTIK